MEKLKHIEKTFSANQSTGFNILVESTLQDNCIPYIYLLECVASIDIQSINEFTLPETPIEASDSEKDAAYYQATKNNPGIVMEIWHGKEQATTKLASLLLWNRRPYYTVNIVNTICTELTDYILCPGYKLYIRFVAWQGGRMLQSNDTVTFYGLYMQSYQAV